MCESQGDAVRVVYGPRRLAGLCIAGDVLTVAELTERDLPPCGCAEPGSANAWTCYCGVEDLLRIIRRRYSLAVMNAIQVKGEARYHDIADSLTSISSSTLAETLQALETVRLIDRRQQPEERPHATYVLTPSGAKLLSRLRQLLDEVDSR